VGARLANRLPWGYFALTFGFSWLVWLPGILGKYKIIPVTAGDARAIAIAGIFGPVFGACVMAYRSGGGIGVKQHLARLFDFRVRPAWWAVIILVPLSIQAAAHFLPILTHEQAPGSYVSSVWNFLSILIMVTLLGGGQEEVGWRGYALDRIQAHFSAFVSSVLLGLFWACWHIPLWFMDGTSQSSTPFGAFLLVCISLSILLTWIYNNTGRNMVAAILTHGMVNAAHPLFPVISPTNRHLYIYWTLANVLAAACITLIWGPASLTGRDVHTESHRQ
jgi:membrane protease YdiL (CAAX protease family)